MADNTLRIEFSGDEGRKPDGGRAGDNAGRPPERSGVEPVRDKPVSVELTKENADLIADYLRGKSTADEVLDKLTSQPDPIQTPGTIPNPATADLGDFVGPTFANADFVGPQLPDPDPIAALIRGGQFAAPEGGDSDIQAELFRQFKKTEDRARADAARDEAAAAKLSAKEGAEADRRTDELIDGVGRLLGLGNISAPARAILGGAEAAAGAEGTGIAGRALGGVATRIAASGVPVGALLAATVADAALDWLIAKPFEMLRGAVDQTAAGMQSLARNDLGGIGERLSEGVADFLGNVGIAGKVWAEQLRTLTAGVRAVDETIDAFVARGRELRGFNADLATANALADVARLQADIREAEVTGESLARLTEAQSSLDQLGREILLILKSGVIDLLAEVVGPVGEMAEAITPVVRTVGDINRTITRAPRELARELFADTSVLPLLQMVWDWWKGKRPDEPDRNSLLAEVFAAARNVPASAPSAPEGSPEQLAGAPLFFGR